MKTLQHILQESLFRNANSEEHAHGEIIKKTFETACPYFNYNIISDKTLEFTKSRGSSPHEHETNELMRLVKNNGFEVMVYKKNDNFSNDTIYFEIEKGLDFHGITIETHQPLRFISEKGLKPINNLNVMCRDKLSFYRTPKLVNCDFHAFEIEFDHTHNLPVCVNSKIECKTDMKIDIRDKQKIFLKDCSMDLEYLEEYYHDNIDFNSKVCSIAKLENAIKWSRSNMIVDGQFVIKLKSFNSPRWYNVFIVFTKKSDGSLLYDKTVKKYVK